jgi:ribosome-associated protein
MKEDLPIKNGIIIPGHELEITASRAGGPGGQHVNKASTRVTVRWNVRTTQALTDEQKERVLQKLAPTLTSEDDLIVHNSSSRSQQQNKKMALQQLADRVRKALHVPKKRMKSKMPQAAKETRLQKKKKHAEIKKTRRKIEY